MCLFICVRACVCARTHLCASVCICVRLCASVHACVRLCTLVCICACLCASVHACVHLCVLVCVCVCLCVSVRACVFVESYRFLSLKIISYLCSYHLISCIMNVNSINKFLSFPIIKNHFLSTLQSFNIIYSKWNGKK